MRWAVACALLGVSLFLNLIGLVALSGIVGQNLTAIAQPIATLTAGILGLGVIAWQTREGFKNVVRQQEHRAEIEETARQREAARAETDRRALRQASVIETAIAFSAELRSLARYVDNLASYNRVRVEVYDRPNLLPIKAGDATFDKPILATPIFERYIDQLYLLGRDLSQSVLLVYADYQTLVAESGAIFAGDWSGAASICRNKATTYEMHASTLKLLAERVEAFAAALT